MNLKTITAECSEWNAVANYAHHVGFHVIDRQMAPWGEEEKIYMQKLR